MIRVALIDEEKKGCNVTGKHGTETRFFFFLCHSGKRGQNWTKEIQRQLLWKEVLFQNCQKTVPVLLINLCSSSVWFPCAKFRSSYPSEKGFIDCKKKKEDQSLSSAWSAWRDVSFSDLRASSTMLTRFKTSFSFRSTFSANTAFLASIAFSDSWCFALSSSSSLLKPPTSTEPPVPVRVRHFCNINMYLNWMKHLIGILSSPDL